MSDCLVVGGGVVGLSLAYELAAHGMRVQVIDAGQPGREASWAGAGILPPASASSSEPVEQLTALSNRLHAEWADDLRSTTGIDNGYRRSGAIYLARNPQERARLDHFHELAASRGISMRLLDALELAELEPAVRPSGKLEGAYLVPDECQIRNPRHLKGLLAGLSKRGVEVTGGVAAEDFAVRGGRVRSVRTNRGSISADVVCVTTGSWTAPLAGKMGLEVAVKPIRGQMVLLSSVRPIVERIINEGSRYLVPRPDGRLLVGSTEEDVGFDRSPTAGAVSELLRFALSLAEDLGSAQIERTWAGLRPATADGLPYLGRVPGLDNAYLAAGHFRSGLQLSTGTALVMRQLVCGQAPQVDLTPFRLDRRHACAGPKPSTQRASIDDAPALTP